MKHPEAMLSKVCLKLVANSVTYKLFKCCDSTLRFMTLSGAGSSKTLQEDFKKPNLKNKNKSISVILG